MKRPVATVGLHAALTLGALVTLAPLAWMVSASLMPTGESNTFPPRWLPSAPTLQHYSDLFTRMNLARGFFNSVTVATLTTILSVALTGMAGYAFAKLRFRGREPLFRMLLAFLVIPGQVGMLPLFLMLKSIGLVNTLAGVMIPGLAPIFAIFMVRQFALAIPDDLLDAARIDGASESRIFWTVVLPVIKPILVTQAAFTFLSMWNDFMWPLIVLSEDSRFTLPVALARLVGEHVQDTELMMAGSVLTVLPVLLVFLAFQRVYTQGVLQGSMKG